MFDFNLIYFSRAAQRELKRAKTLSRKTLLAPSDLRGQENKCLFYPGVKCFPRRQISNQCGLIG